jgi:multiple sugar transport system substrate-binding protein
MLKRREFLKAMATYGVGIAASGTGLTWLESCGGSSSGSSTDFNGQTLTVVTQTGPPIASAVQKSIEPFKKATGANVKLVTIPFGQLFPKLMSEFVTGGSNYDVVLGSSNWLGDFNPYIVDLTDRIKGDSSLNWNDVLYKGAGQWAGRQVAMPVDGDNQLAYYRRDILQDKGLSDAYQKQFGKPLAPPDTWDDFMNIARFFGDGSHGIHGVVEAYRHGGQAFWFYMSHCVAYCSIPGQQGGLFFDPDNLKPLINDPGHVRGMQNYAEAIKYGPPGMINFDSNEVRQRFANGEAVLAVDWDDTPIIGELQASSKAKGQIGTQLLPGATQVWDYKKQQWVAQSSPNRPAWLAFGGWCGVVPKKAHNQDLAYKYLSFLASPSFSMQMVTLNNSGMNPYRKSHFANVQAWQQAGYPQPDLDAYLKAMEQSDEDSHAVRDLRLPGSATFQDDAEVAAQQVVSGQASAQDALNQLAQKWDRTNQQKGKEKQRKAYRASLNLAVTGG